MTSIRLVLALAALLPASAQAPLAFRTPPKVIQDLVDVETPPSALVDPRARVLALVKRPALLTLEDLAQPELRLAGLRINPRTHNLSRTRTLRGLELREVATGKAIPVTGLPADLRFEHPVFSPTGAHLALVEVQAAGLALWTVDTATGRARRLTEPVLSAVLGAPFAWSPDGAGLFVRVRATLDPCPEGSALPQGPAVQEATGVRAPSRTYQDLLHSPADEARFAYYATTRIQRVDLEGRTAGVLPPALYRGILPAPGGAFLLVTELVRPFSYLFPESRFPSTVRIVTASGAPVATLAQRGLQDRIPVDFDACEAGRRRFQWREDEAATVAWTEAQDGGVPSRDVPLRDHVYQLRAPFTGEPALVFQARYRLHEIVWGDDRTAIAVEDWWKTRRARTSLVDPSRGGPGRLLFERSSEDAYGDPGDFVTARNAFNRMTLLFSQDRKRLYLEGEGCGPKGNRPFLDAFDPATGRAERLWQADGAATYERIVRVLDPSRLLTQIQGPARFPDLNLRTLGKKPSLQALTHTDNPYKALAGVSRTTLHYKRADGVDLSAVLHLPAGYDPARDGRLPVLMEAYPTEFKDAANAGQVKESPNLFSAPRWSMPLYWTLRGYAVLENAKFPIVGQGSAEPNDTYIEQLVANAKAAIDELDRLGVGDRKRVACMGHSYGAFMVANLLAHSDLFAAGIARSGAYNRTLTPFGFQAEERTYWQAPGVYHAMSPFDAAEKIKAPILLIHGDADNNPGTFTLQSERLFQAIKGLGGRARLVLLPLESHSYAARENILHMLWEQDQWLETYVKGR